MGPGQQNTLAAADKDVHRSVARVNQAISVAVQRLSPYSNTGTRLCMKRVAAQSQAEPGSADSFEDELEAQEEPVEGAAALSEGAAPLCGCAPLGGGQ